MSSSPEMSSGTGAMRPSKVVNLLGPPLAPTDGVTDHALALSGALHRLGHRATVLHHRWDREGWFRTLRALRKQVLGADVVVMHHTHLAWSRRGFPVRALFVAASVGRRRLWLLLHDPLPFPSATLVGRARAATQVAVMWILVRLATRAYVTIHPACVPWARRTTARRLRLLPVGSNVGEGPKDESSDMPSPPFTIVVFAMTRGHREDAWQVTRVVTEAAEMLDEEIRVVAFGGGTEVSQGWLERELGPSVEFVASGVLPTSEVAARMREANAQLFVRGSASSRRSTLVAGIAHGVPIVAFEGKETCWPITEAGVDLVPFGDHEAAARALVRVATDPTWAARQRQRNAAAYRRYFSWEVIAGGLMAGGIRR